MRNRLIISAYGEIVRPATDREIMKRLGFTETNAVRPRITEMLDRGILRQVDQVYCKVTGKLVRACQISKKEKEA